MLWEIRVEKALTVIFAADLIAYAFVGVSLSDATFMERFKQIMQHDSHDLRFEIVILLAFAPLFTTQNHQIFFYRIEVSC